MPIDRPVRLQADELSVYKMFASVTTTAVQCGFFGPLSGLICCGGTTWEACEEMAAKLRALYSLDHPCTILGLNIFNLDTISKEEVERAYRRSARKVHPDRGGSAEGMYPLEVAQCVLLDTRWRKAYSRSGWVGVHAAWKKAGCSSPSSLDAEAIPIQARPEFAGIATPDGLVLVVPVTALQLVDNAEDRELFESPHWLLLPRGKKLYGAATYVDDFLQSPVGETPACRTDASASGDANPGMRTGRSSYGRSRPHAVGQVVRKAS